MGRVDVPSTRATSRAETAAMPFSRATVRAAFVISSLVNFGFGGKGIILSAAKERRISNHVVKHTLYNVIIIVWGGRKVKLRAGESGYTITVHTLNTAA